MIPDEIVDRLASEIARRSGYDPNKVDVSQWPIIRDKYRETAKQYLRVALGHSAEFDLPNEVTYDSTTNEIKGVDENWYEVPQPVLMRYVMTVGIAGANLTEHSTLSDEQLEQAATFLYPNIYKSINEPSRKVIRDGLRAALLGVSIS